MHVDEHNLYCRTFSHSSMYEWSNVPFVKSVGYNYRAVDIAYRVYRGGKIAQAHIQNLLGRAPLFSRKCKHNTRSVHAVDSR